MKKEIKLKPITKAQIRACNKWVSKFIKTIERAHKNASKSKLVFNT